MRASLRRAAAGARRGAWDARSWRRLISRSFFHIAHPQVSRVIQRVLVDRRTYLESDALRDLARAALTVESNDLEGAIVEAGCALGGSAIVLASAKAPERPMYVYDTFGMIPAPSEKDGQDVHERYKTIVGGHSQGIGSDVYYGYRQDLYEQVRASFAKYDVAAERNNVRLIKGLFQETMRVDFPIALVHIDCDWYASVMTCLSRIEPSLVAGGVLIVDDFDAWSGCRKAVEEYFGDKRDQFEFGRRTRLYIRKGRPRTQTRGARCERGNQC